MPTYLLDTNTCIAVLRQKKAVLVRLLRHAPNDIAIASMSIAELWFGALKSSNPARGRALTDAFLEPFQALPFDESAAESYARVRMQLEARGTPIGERDLIIASIALAHGLTVVTHNTREFGRVDGLIVDDWSVEGGTSEGATATPEWR
jgi:tRNA(fMet)-specific endonuclease VapC